MFNQAILAYIENSPSTSQLGQAWINFQFFEHLCKGEWEDFLAKFSYHGKVNFRLVKILNSFKLKIMNSFDQSRKQIEQWIQESVKRKVVDFVMLAVSVNWAPSAPRTEPHDYVQGI